MQITEIESDEKIYQDLQSLVTQLGIAKKLYPSALIQMAKNSKIEIGKYCFDKPIKEEDNKVLVLAKLQVDKINNNLEMSYGN